MSESNDVKQNLDYSNSKYIIKLKRYKEIKQRYRFPTHVTVHSAFEVTFSYLRHLQIDHFILHYSYLHSLAAALSLVQVFISRTTVTRCSDDLTQKVSLYRTPRHGLQTMRPYHTSIVLIGLAFSPATWRISTGRHASSTRPCLARHLCTDQLITCNLVLEGFRCLLY